MLQRSRAVNEIGLKKQVNGRRKGRSRVEERVKSCESVRSALIRQVLGRSKRDGDDDDDEV